MLILTILTFIIILGLLVFVHEFGHFITARLFGVRVHEFAFGFPPRITAVRRGETTYAINWIPLGGYVKIKGEQGEERGERDSFASRPIWQRAIMLSAGVVMNVILAYVLIAGSLMVGYPDVIDGAGPLGATVRNRELHVTELRPALPASEHLLLGDVVAAVDGARIASLEAFQRYIAAREGVPVTLALHRGDHVVEQQLTPVFSKEEGRAIIGVGLLQTGLVSYHPIRAIWEGVVKTLELFVEIIRAFAILIRDLLVERHVTVPLSGPVGIAVLTGLVVKLGVIYIVQFAALLSLNLAIINFLPFPALDGGRVLFLAIEKLRGKAVEAKLENLAHNIGFALLMALVVLVTYRDLTQWGGDILRVLKRTVGL